MTADTRASETVRTHRVVADDGALLAVQVRERRADATTDATLVLAHGWTLTHAAWEPVVTRLVAEHGLRVVTWDQRGHGGSTLAGGRYRGSGLSIKQLGTDLATVLAATAPEGPLVLGGHSMGGMTVMAYAGQHPDVVTHRVRGVGFVATSAGDLAAGARTAQVRAMKLLAHGRSLTPGRAITLKGQRSLLFGTDADPADVARTRAQVAGTKLAAFGGFYDALMQHDEAAALGALGEVPVRIIVGDRDKLTPLRHAEALAAALPGAGLEVVPGAGHMLTYEATDRVTAMFSALLTA